MPSADQVPVNSTHSTMRWHKWVVLIAGSTGSALRAVGPPNPSHHTGYPARSRLRRQRDGLLITFTLGHHGGNLGRAPAQQRREPRPMPGAMDSWHSG